MSKLIEWTQSRGDEYLCYCNVINEELRVTSKPLILWFSDQPDTEVAIWILATSDAFKKADIQIGDKLLVADSEHGIFAGVEVMSIDPQPRLIMKGNAKRNGMLRLIATNARRDNTFWKLIRSTWANQAILETGLVKRDAIKDTARLAKSVKMGL